MPFNVRPTRFGFPARAASKPRSSHRIFRPTGGFHAGDHPADLVPGFTPEAQNWVTEGGELVVRSGLSQMFAFKASTPVLGGSELYDVNGERAAWSASTSSVLYMHPDNDTWSALSYIRGSTLASDDQPSGLSTDYWEGVQAYDNTAGQFVNIISNGTNWMKWHLITPSVNTFSDFTWVNSLDSINAAKAVSKANERVVLFHTLSSDGTSKPNRVAWSARGLPFDWTQNNGAGYEDLVDMRGAGQAAVRWEGDVYLFTNLEVWVARPTLDDYAFRFTRTSSELGTPWPRTAVATPLGVMFLAQDKEVYVARGTEVVALGPAGQGEESRIQQRLREEFKDGDRAWATYNAGLNRYELYYVGKNDSSVYPKRALYFSLEDGSWSPQKFDGHELTIGFDLHDPGAAETWGDLTGTWADQDGSWGDYGASSESRFPVVWDSGGSVFRVYSGQTNDDGTAIDARWRSHGLSQRDAMRQAALTELWMDYRADSASSLSVLVSSDLGAAWTSVKQAALSASSGTNERVPMWTVAQNPMFEVRTEDGRVVRIRRFQTTLQDEGVYRGP